MKRIWTLALVAAMAAACQEKEGPAAVVPGSVSIEPVITKATEVDFENGDKIGLSMKKVNDTEAFATNAELTFAEDVFTGELKWYTDAYSASNLYAYYPYDSEGVPTEFSVALDQTSGLGTSDFMAAAKENVLPTFGAVTMVFKHQMTKLAISIDNQTGSPVSEVLVQNTVPTAAIDVTALSAVPAEGVEAADIKAYEVTDNAAYSAIVVPQTAAIKIKLTFENKKVMTQPLAPMTLKGGGQYTIEVRVLADEMQVNASGDIQNWTDEGKIEPEGGSQVEELPVTFTEHEGYFEYDGVRYNTVTLSNGRTWMAEPLRFVPRGKTVSSDPSDGNGIWYSYKVTDAVGTAVTDDESVEKLGYLYDFSAAFGEEITIDNYDDFEGTKGICPTGWHIPTRAELAATFGNVSKSLTEAAIVDSSAPFYEEGYEGGSVSQANTAGFNFTFSGAVINGAYNKLVIDSSVCSVEDYYEGNRVSYILGSTPYQLTTNTDGSLKNIQYFGVMTTFNSTFKLGKLAAPYVGYKYAGQVRCVKDQNN